MCRFQSLLRYRAPHRDDRVEVTEPHRDLGRMLLVDGCAGVLLCAVAVSFAGLVLLVVAVPFEVAPGAVLAEPLVLLDAVS